MIGRVGQTQSNFLENIQQKNTTKNTVTTIAKSDVFIPSSSKPDLWNYSFKEVKSPLTRGFSASKPNWSTIPTRGGRTLSDVEMLEQMRNVARREVLMEQSKNFEQESAGIERTKQYLVTQYISDVSPDRKALYNRAEKEIQKAEEDQPTYPISFTLVDIVCDLDEVAEVNGNQGTVTTAYTTGYGTDYELNIGGQRVMGTTRGQWVYYATPLEEEKRKEFYDIYNAEKEKMKKLL